MLREGRYTPLNLKCHFTADVKTVFDYWTVPFLASQWLFREDSNGVQFLTDLKIGGMYKIIQQWPDEKKQNAILCSGQYIDIINPAKLVFTMDSPTFFGPSSTITIHITPRKDGSVLNLVHAGVDTSLIKKHWKSMFKNLQHILK